MRKTIKLKDHFAIRLVVLLCGLFCIALGVALSTKSGLGVSPSASLPYLLCKLFPLSMGSFTTLINIFFVFVQIALLRKQYRPIQLLQLAVVFLFGFFTDFTIALVSGVTVTNYALRLVLCLASCAVMAFGVYLEVKAGLIVMASEGAINAFSQVFKFDFGKVKIALDCSFVIISTCVSFLCFHTLLGIREGTILAAILVGLFVQFQKIFLISCDKCPSLRIITIEADKGGVFMNRRRSTIAAVMTLLALAVAVLILCRSNLPHGGDKMETLKITIRKVGKADALVLQAGDETLVIDVGEEEDGEEVVKFLTDQGINTVDALIITHFDKDHVGGADTLVERLNVRQVLLPDYQGSGTEYLDFLAALERKGLKPQRLTEPLSFRLGDAEVLVEPPASYEAAEMTDALDNDFSLITTVTHGENTFLFTGDAEKARLREWLSGGSVGACDFLKIPHHGVYNTALEDLLEATLPKYAVICTSEKHPAQTQTLELLKQYNVRTLQTKDGDITALSDGLTLEVRQDMD